MTPAHVFRRILTFVLYLTYFEDLKDINMSFAVSSEQYVVVIVC